MRHGCKINHLSRTHAHRVAMLSNMATSLILEKRIETTLAKAKALRVYVEPLINRSKEDTTNNRRVVFSYLHSKSSTTTRTCLNPSLRRKLSPPVVAAPRRLKPPRLLLLQKLPQSKKPPRPNNILRVILQQRNAGCQHSLHSFFSACRFPLQATGSAVN